jgi:transcriptional regulator GlxA family with amidase domain
MSRIGIFVFDDVEELDFVGPWEIFGMAKKLGQEGELVLVAEHDRPVRCAKGMRVLPDHTFASTPPLDMVLVPGGQGTRREVKNPAAIEWLRGVGARCQWVTSVCSGALLLHEAGFARGKRMTTHWSVIEELRARGDGTVLEGVRFVRDGQVVTSAGVSAGIDMALWLVGQLHGAEFARRVQKMAEYYPAPPYTAEA